MLSGSKDTEFPSRRHCHKKCLCLQGHDCCCDIDLPWSISEDFELPTFLIAQELNLLCILMKPFFRIRLLKRYNRHLQFVSSSLKYLEGCCIKKEKEPDLFSCYVVSIFQINHLPNADYRFNYFHPLCTPSIGIPFYASLPAAHGFFALWYVSQSSAITSSYLCYLTI